jgi:hypothetical protein
MAVIDPEKLKEAAPKLLEALLRVRLGYEADVNIYDEIERGLEAAGLDTYDKAFEAAKEMGIIL